MDLFHTEQQSIRAGNMIAKMFDINKVITAFIVLVALTVVIHSTTKLFEAVTEARELECKRQAEEQTRLENAEYWPSPYIERSPSRQRKVRVENEDHNRRPRAGRNAGDESRGRSRE